MKSKPPRFQRTPKPWKTLGGRKLIDLGEVKLYRDRIQSKSGFRTHHLRLSLHDFSIIVPVLDDKRLVFIWNYRHPIQGWELELPAGLIDPGETPQTGAKRELKEETGYSARSWKTLGWLHTLPGISAQKAHVFLARDLKKGKIEREPYEYMKIKLLKAEEAYKLLHSGGIIHSPTVSALSLAEKTILR
ncbi:MAG TPA: NUDIX hydrolase [Candidatus Bathyarchaeia archaeon]|nr:NUDIX hydrolase [Candidatus Bathyarchaeia archaeon]